MKNKENEYEDYVIDIAYRRKSDISKRVQLTNAKEVYDFVLKMYDGIMEHHERMYALYLDNNLSLIAAHSLGDGTLTNMTLDTRFLLQGAILSNAAAVMLVHNHPSGNVIPSESDKKLEEKVKGILELVNIQLVDFIVIGNSIYYSFLEAGDL